MENSVVKLNRVNVSKMTDLKEIISFYKSELFNNKRNNKSQYNPTIEKIIQAYEEELASIEKNYDKIMDFFENGLRKFYKVKFINNLYYDEIYMYPYMVTMSNKMIHAVFDFNDNYNSGMYDTYFSLDNFFESDTEITEITQEEFVKKCSENITRPLEERMKKIILRKK